MCVCVLLFFSYLAIVSSDVEPSGCSVVLLNNLHSRHEASNTHIVVGVLLVEKYISLINTEHKPLNIIGQLN